MKDLHQYIVQHQDRFLDELFSLIKIPSISSKEQHKPDMYKCASRWKELLIEAGVDSCDVMETKGHPVVFAQKIVDPTLPTILVYGHYDVMPVDPEELWKSKPFDPEIRDGKIWARGADDDKGQSFMHAKAFEYLVQSNQLSCNVKFMLEGEEEIGSTNLYEYCQQNIEL